MNILRNKKSLLSSISKSSVRNRMSPAVNRGRSSSKENGAINIPRNNPGNSAGQVGQSGEARSSGDAENSAPAAGKTQLAPIDINVPQQISKYTIGGKLGSGTCGVVHKALDTVLDREVAIKLSPIGEPHLSTGKVPGAQRAYQTEIFAAGKLRHPNIVTVHDAGQYDDLNYLVMEAVTGQSLKFYGKGQKLLPVHRSIEVIIECCLALDYSHSQGILHRDIKPANIMISDTNAVKLLDFGIAVGLEEDGGLNRKGPTLGTPNYMSPEQILGKTLGPASDFYSLATVLFELITGKQLFKAKKVKDLFRTVVHQEAPRLCDIRPDLPSDLSRVIEKALRKKPEERYQSGSEMAADLQPFVEHFRSIENRSPEHLKLVQRLRTQSFFSSVSEVDVARLLAEVNVRTFEPHDEVLEGGNLERRLLILTDGVVKSYESGRLCRVYSAGDCIGELGFIQGNRERWQLFAASRVNALEVCAGTLAALPPSMHLRYYKKISDIMVRRMGEGDALQLDVML